MGVNLKGLIIFSSVSVSDLVGKRVAVDAFNAIYQFLSSIRQFDGSLLRNSRGEVSSHLSGLFYRSVNLLSQGVRLGFVFDGKPPSFKSGVVEERRLRRERAREEFERAVSRGDFVRAKSFAARSSVVTPVMVEQCVRLVRALGLPVIRAPSEAEAQVAFLVGEGLFDFASSQDYDCLLFGSPNLLRNLSVGRGKGLELALLRDNLSRLGLSREKLVWLALLVGTDFNRGVRGVGPKRALKLVRECDSLESVKRRVGWDEPVEEVVEFFLNPPVLKGVRVEWGEVDREAVLKLLVDEFDFSEERVVSALDKLSGCSQKFLFDF